MRRLTDIKKAIGRANIESKSQANRVFLEDLLAEFEAVKAAASGPVGTHGWRIVAGSRGARLIAAAAVVVLALALIGRGPHEPAQPHPESRAESLADLLTVGHLNAVYRRGGLEAVNRRCEEAVRRLDNGSEGISIDQLLVELQEDQQTKG